MAQRGQVDLALGPAARALDLEPRVAAVDALVDGRRRIDRPAVGPHLLVPGFAQQLVGRPDQGRAFGPGVGRLRGEDRGHRTGPPELLGESLARSDPFWARKPTTKRGSGD